MNNYCRNRNYNYVNSRNSNCAGSFTAYIPVTVTYDMAFGNGFIGTGGNGAARNVDCYMPAAESSCYTPAEDSCL